MASENIIESLEDGLILRTATMEDSEALAKFNGTIHVDPGEDFVEHISLWTKDLLSGKHPTTSPEDFTIVEDTSTGEIVSTLVLIGQTWSYEGIEFAVGRPELVATHPNYRRRGLVRKQFEVIHGWSEARGHKMQFITGIPWYYRQFGYEMAVNLGGRRQGSVDSIPELKKEEEEPFHFRPAEEKDIPFLADLYKKSSRRNLLHCPRDEKLWAYEFSGRTPESSMQYDIQMIESPDRTPAGYFFTVPVLYEGKVYIRGLELEGGISWFEAAGPILRQIQKTGSQFTERTAVEKKPNKMTGFCFDLGEDHPIYHIIPDKMPLVQNPYAYYIRVPDLPSFLQMISPVLEERLARSYMSGHTGDLKLNFYRSGIQMHFEKGRLKAVEPWAEPQTEGSSANYPGLTFLQLVFGYRDVQQLEDAFADCYYQNASTKYLLSALFPRKPSHVWDFA